MPTYDYRCRACRHEFEQFQSITASPLRKCPKCGRKTLQRLIGTGGGIIFKGSGFYQTDYRSESYKKAAEADRKPASTGDDGKAGDSKAADKSASDTPKGSDGPAAPADSKARCSATGSGRKFKTG